MGRVLIGAVAGGIVLYAWGFLFWGISGVPYQALSRTADDAAAGRAMLEHFPQTGTYYVPGPHNPEVQLERQHEAGPTAFVFFNREGWSMLSVKTLISGLVHAIVFSFIVALALRLLGSAVPSYGNRVRLVALIGVAGAIWSPVGNVIWWNYPPAWQWWIAFSDAVSWVLLALVAAYFVRPRTVPAEIPGRL